ncbi:hypothetical protein T09_984 [Trichinella sp. T9]|uniref:Uncharacterized protein n=1 Tax=Trichinella murrelli TaxID=144512 RepID=A0A0V0TW32_9BILA|nr:hypothetical protein T05_7452 [Trichinella murrelli]KRX67645.1 hypothetical protein T09_984 [Trichinella sp. T9]
MCNNPCYTVALLVAGPAETRRRGPQVAFGDRPSSPDTSGMPVADDTLRQRIKAPA